MVATPSRSTSPSKRTSTPRRKLIAAQRYARGLRLLEAVVAIQTNMLRPIRVHAGDQFHAAVAVKVHDNVNRSPTRRCSSRSCGPTTGVLSAKFVDAVEQPRDSCRAMAGGARVQGRFV